MYGIYCGQNATVAIIEEFCVSFLRLNDGHIISLISHRKDGVMGIVMGKGVVSVHSQTSNDDSLYCIKDIYSGNLHYNDRDMSAKMGAHKDDLISVDNMGEMTYTMYDGTIFSLKLAEKISREYFEKMECDEELPVSRKMALWNIGKFYETSEKRIRAGIDTERYSIIFYIDTSEEFIYCRVGQNGYCEKGWAMKSTTCIRKNECRMIENNLEILNKYEPIKECFVTDSCAFPSDGGWYWSLKAVEDNVIYLNGCGGEIYEIHK